MHLCGKDDYLWSICFHINLFEIIGKSKNALSSSIAENFWAQGSSQRAKDLVRFEFL